MTAREKLIRSITEAIDEAEKAINSRRAYRDQGPISHREAAEVALKTLERPLHQEEETYIICTCGQNGYTGWHSNHPHLKGCPHESSS